MKQSSDLRFHFKNGNQKWFLCIKNIKKRCVRQHTNYTLLKYLHAIDLIHKYILLCIIIYNYILAILLVLYLLLNLKSWKLLEYNM